MCCKTKSLDLSATCEKKLLIDDAIKIHKLQVSYIFGLQIAW